MDQEDRIEQARLRFRQLIWQMDWSKTKFFPNKKKSILPQYARRINERLGFIQTNIRGSNIESLIVPPLLFYYWPAEYAFYKFYQSDENIEWQEYEKMFKHFCSKDSRSAQTSWRFLIDILDAEGKRPIPYEEIKL